MHTIPDDVINHLAGITPGSRLDLLRDERPEAKKYAQKGFFALFAPKYAKDMLIAERFAVAAFTALLHHAEDVAAFYSQGLADTGARPALAEAVRQAALLNLAQGPYGAYPPGPLSREDTAGPVYAAPGTAGEPGPRLSAAFAHAFMLTYHPRDAKAAHLQTLLAAGWTADGIVTLSQLVTFLAYQIRLIHGLRAMLEGGITHG